MNNKWRRQWPVGGLLRACVGAMFVLGMSFFSAGTWAESWSLAVGEYPPFVGQKELNGGVTADLVTAIFKQQNIDVKYVFLPWKRGYQETGMGKYVGTFPYLKTPERELTFLFSEPFYSDQFRMFVRNGGGDMPGWADKTVCIPLGYDTSQLQEFIRRNNIRLEHPSEIKNCFLMLERGRVDAVWVSQLVGADLIRTMFGKNAPIRALDLNLVGPVNYYLMVSRRLSDAQQRVALFNSGLKGIQKNGTFGKIVSRHAAF